MAIVRRCSGGCSTPRRCLEHPWFDVIHRGSRYRCPRTSSPFRGAPLYRRNPSRPRSASSGVLVQIAISYWHQRKYGDTLAWAERALDVDPRHVQVCQFINKVYLKIGDVSRFAAWTVSQAIAWGFPEERVTVMMEPAASMKRSTASIRPSRPATQHSFTWRSRRIGTACAVAHRSPNACGQWRFLRSRSRDHGEPPRIPRRDHRLRRGPFHERIDDRHSTVVLAIGEILRVQNLGTRGLAC